MNRNLARSKTRTICQADPKANRFEQNWTEDPVILF